MRISDWSSDVCSSDLRRPRLPARLRPGARRRAVRLLPAAPAISGPGDSSDARCTNARHVFPFRAHEARTSANSSGSGARDRRAAIAWVVVSNSDAGLTAGGVTFSLQIGRAHV